MSKASNLIKNTAIIAMGKLSSQLIGFLLLPLYTHYLNPTEYGFVDLAITYISLLVPALTLQLEMASFRYLVDARSNREDRIRVISNILYMTLPLVLPWVACFTFFGIITDFTHTWSILLAGMAMLCANLLLQMTRGLGGNKQFAIASILTGLSTLLGALIFIVLLNMRIDGVLLSIAFANGIAALYLLIRQRLYKYVQLNQYDKKLQRDILGYSIPLVPNGIAWWVINASDRTIITIMIGAAANGIYTVATKYSAILNSLFGIFSMSWTESASMHINSPDRDRFFSQVANSAVRIFGALGLGLIATIPFVFPLMVNKQFYEAYLYIPIMVISVFFNMIVGIYSAIYVAKRLTKQVMNTSLVSAVINIVLSILLIPVLGLYAPALTTAVAFLAMAIFRHYDIKKYVRIQYEKRIFMTLTLLYIVVMYLYYVHTLWSSTIGLLIAVIASYWLSKNELRSMKNMVSGRLQR